MADDLKKLLGEEEPEPKPPEAEKPKGEEPPAKNQDSEVAKKEEQLVNLGKAITEAQIKLKELRKPKPSPEEEDDLPKINLEDPSAKAWDKHIKENVSPLQAVLDKEREEVRSFALRTFLAEKPALAKNPEKVKELMETYERLHTCSERTSEGVLMDLQKSYGAVFHEELISAARNERIEQAQADSVFSDIAVSRGATKESVQPNIQKPLSEEDKAMVGQWEKSGAPKI